MTYLSMILLLLGAFFDGGGNAVVNMPNQNTSPTLNTQKVYCERSHTNFAWGYQHHGIYVDAVGNLYSYSYQPKAKPWSPKQGDAPTTEELEEKYSHGRKLIRKIELQELQANLKLLAAARNGQLSKRKQRGADMGSNVCRCYVADAAGQGYKQIELRVQGDWSYENLAPSAKVLADWLDSLHANSEKKVAR